MPIICPERGHHCHRVDEIHAPQILFEMSMLPPRVVRSRWKVQWHERDTPSWRILIAWTSQGWQVRPRGRRRRRRKARLGTPSPRLGLLRRAAPLWPSCRTPMRPRRRAPGPRRGRRAWRPKLRRSGARTTSTRQASAKETPVEEAPASRAARCIASSMGRRARPSVRAAPLGAPPKRAPSPRQRG